MAQVFERGLTKPTGYVLPVQRWNAQAAGPRWRSEKWKTRRGKLFLVPGDSPGRLPPAARLAALCAAGAVSLYRAGRSVGAARAAADARGASCRRPSRRRRRRRAGRAAAGGVVHRRRPAQQDRVEQELGEIGGAVRTAISVEPRDGRLCVFMPPVEALEDYLELIAAAENAAQGDRPAGPYRRLRARRTTRASTSSASRPIPASSRSTSIRPSNWQDCVATTDGDLRGGAAVAGSAPTSS